MNMRPVITGSSPPIDIGLLLRAALAPAVFWAGTTILITLSGQPGVFCITPVAWLLAVWSGTFYGQRVGPQRSAALGGAIAGLILGAIMAALFAFGSARMMVGETRADELSKNQTLTLAIGLGSVVVCVALAALMAHVAQRRMR